MSTTNDPRAENATSAEDATPRYGAILELKKALKRCLMKPRRKLNGGNLERKRGW
jgi:hypothetical protein